MFAQNWAKNHKDDEMREVAFYVTCGVVDLRSSDALRRKTKYVNAQ